MLRLLLVEDHASFRSALAFVLNLQPGMEVVAECGSVAGCRALGRLDTVDVAILDLMLPDGNGADLVVELREDNPNVKVLVLTASIGSGDADDASRAEGLGADGFLSKAASLEEIASEVTRLAGGAKA